MISHCRKCFKKLTLTNETIYCVDCMEKLNNIIMGKDVHLPSEVEEALRQLTYQFVFEDGSYVFIADQSFKKVTKKFHEKWPNVEPKAIILLKVSDFNVL